jgi:hypothetical protein
MDVFMYLKRVDVHLSGIDVQKNSGVTPEGSSTKP